MGVFMRDSVVNTAGKVQYEVVRRPKRKRIAIRITDDAQVVVSAPKRTPAVVIERFVQSKTDWIDAKLDLVRSLPQPLEAHTYADGDTFLLLGNIIGLRVQRVRGIEAHCTLEDQLLHVHVSPRAKEVTIKKSIHAWYAAYGEQLYRALVERWVLELALPFIPQVGMAPYRRRMGSCSKDGRLMFAVRSLTLPMRLIEYLALHEVAHLVHFDHGSSFKRFLHAHMEDWRQREREMARLRLRSSGL